MRSAKAPAAPTPRSAIDAAEQTMREAQTDYDRNQGADPQVAQDRLAVLSSARKDLGRLVGQAAAVRFCYHPSPGTRVHVVFGERSLCDDRARGDRDWRPVAELPTCPPCKRRWEALKRAAAGDPLTGRGDANLRRSLTERGLLPDLDLGVDHV